MKSTLSVIILLLCTIGPIAAFIVYERKSAESYTAEILARAPERGNFLPRRLTLPVGRPVRLRIRNVDTVTHGFTIPDLDIDIGDLKAGRQVIVEFTPTKTGEYVYYCTAWCSEHHLQMRGVLNVVAP